MLGLLTKAKAWGWVIASAVLAILAAVARIRILEHQRDKARQQAKVAKAGLERKAETEEREAEIGQKWSDWEREANENIDREPDPPK
jgi:hypothetical protein